MIATMTSDRADIRKRAAERFEAHGFPTTREEEWRFTSVAPIARAQFPAAAPSLKNGHSLRAALERDPGLIEAYLGQYASCENPFVALNTANFEDGAFLRIPANTV